MLTRMSERPMWNSVVQLRAGACLWSARGHRKGRYPALPPQTNARYPPIRWYFVWQPNNISWWVAHLFLWGSVCWVINGFFLVWPMHNDTGNANVTSSSAFCGGVLFIGGAFLAVTESLNIGHSCEFGEALQFLMGETTVATLHNFSLGSRTPSASAVDPVTWRWCGTDCGSFGYVASAVQLAAAIVFGVSVITGLPGLRGALSVAVSDTLYWATQILGGAGFVAASALLMREEQPSACSFQPCRIGWQVGLWNLIGGIGFTLSGVFGLAYTRGPGAMWGVAFSSLWGAWAFLIGSYLQLLEVINPHPRPLGCCRTM